MDQAAFVNICIALFGFVCLVELVLIGMLTARVRALYGFLGLPMKQHKTGHRFIVSRQSML